MALSTRARIAALGGGLALGVLGATGYAYAAGDSGTGAGVSYVTTDDGSGSPAGTDRDCPGHGGSGGSGDSGSPAPGGTAPETPSGTAPVPNPADA